MLKDLRKRAGLTQAELAIKLGIKQGSISNWENGTSKPDIPMAVKLAEFLKVNVDEVVACFTEKKEEG